MDATALRNELRLALTENLLDRTTVYRGEIEIPAVEIIEAELKERGVNSSDVDAHAARRAQSDLLRHADGSVVRCNYCTRPAAVHRWMWHRLWGWFLPLFPRRYHLCDEHHQELPRDPHGRVLHFDVDQGLNRGS